MQQSPYQLRKLLLVAAKMIQNERCQFQDSEYVKNIFSWKKNVHVLFFTILLISITGKVNAQILSIRADTLVWEVNQVNDQLHSSTTDYPSQFITYGGTKILWVQHNYNNEFIINTLTGNWDNPSVSGSIEYAVILKNAAEIGNKSGTILISKSESGIHITTNFPENGQNSLPYIFNVTAVSKKL